MCFALLAAAFPKMKKKRCREDTFLPNTQLRLYMILEQPSTKKMILSWKYFSKEKDRKDFIEITALNDFLISPVASKIAWQKLLFRLRWQNQLPQKQLKIFISLKFGSKKNLIQKIFNKINWWSFLTHKLLDSMLGDAKLNLHIFTEKHEKTL